MTFKKGHTINVGRVLSENTKNKIRDSQIGMTRTPLSEEHKQKISIANRGNTHSIESKKRMSNARLGMLFTEEHRKNISDAHKGLLAGEKHPNWKGGITSKNRRLRHASEYIDWRNKVFERDDFTCKNYNCPFCNNERGVELHPHHIKPFANYEQLRYDVDNGIAYCSKYHIHGGLHKIIKKR